MQYHPQAKLTIHHRRAMREEFLAGASLKELAVRYHVATKTVQKWVHRDTFTDRSAAPHRRRTQRPPA
jgi:uncharacterized protein YjcR